MDDTSLTLQFFCHQGAGLRFHHGWIPFNLLIATVGHTIGYMSNDFYSSISIDIMEGIVSVLKSLLINGKSIRRSVCMFSHLNFTSISEGKHCILHGGLGNDWK